MGKDGTQNNTLQYIFAGGTAGMISRTCVAPIERVKIMYQVTRSGSGTLRNSWRIIEDGFRATTVRNVGVAQHQDAGFKSHFRKF